MVVLMVRQRIVQWGHVVLYWQLKIFWIIFLNFAYSFGNMDHCMRCHVIIIFSLDILSSFSIKWKSYKFSGNDCMLVLFCMLFFLPPTPSTGEYKIEEEKRRKKLQEMIACLVSRLYHVFLVLVVFCVGAVRLGFFTNPNFAVQNYLYFTVHILLECPQIRQHYRIKNKDQYTNRGMRTCNPNCGVQEQNTCVLEICLILH